MNIIKDIACHKSPVAHASNQHAEVMVDTVVGHLYCCIWVSTTAMLHTTVIGHFRVTAFPFYHLSESVLHAR